MEVCWILETDANIRSNLDGGSIDFSKKLFLIDDGKVTELANKKIAIDKDLGEIVTNIEDVISKKYLDVANIDKKNYQ